MTDEGPQRGKVLSLFTGAGGLDRGLEAAGFDTVACIEIDPICAKTLQRNRSQWVLLDTADVTIAKRTVTPESLNLEVGELDLIAGGPPCQPFSMAAQWSKSGRRGMDDDRAQTIVAMLDLVEAFLPKAVLIENVAGFLRGKVSASPFIAERLREINERHDVSYDLQAQIVDSADYGVPQRRNRVIAVATRDGSEFKMPDPTHSGGRHITAWDALQNLPEEDEEPPVGNGNFCGLLPSIPEGSNYQYLTAKGGGEELFGYRTRYWSFLLKLAKDKPAWTLSASPGPSTGPFHWENRPLTVRESLRLQSFPDEWQLEGNFRQQIKQAGNATPPLLAEVVGRALREQLNGSLAGLPAEPELEIKKAGPPPPPREPVPVPDEFRNLIGAKSAHPGAGLGPSPRMERPVPTPSRRRADSTTTRYQQDPIPTLAPPYSDQT